MHRRLLLSFYLCNNIIGSVFFKVVTKKTVVNLQKCSSTEEEKEYIFE